MANIFKTNESTLLRGLSRTRFPVKFFNPTSFDAGRLIPFMCVETLPGDTWSLDMAALIRMQTPIAPIMDDIYADFYFFYVPNRVISNALAVDGKGNFEKVVSITSGYDGVLDGEKVENLSSNSERTVKIIPHSVGDYLGLPIGVYDKANFEKLSAHIPSGYAMIWNYFFRDENYQTENAITNSVPPFDSDGNEPINFYNPVTFLPFKVNNYHNLFTSVLPAPQKGPAVLLPLGGAAPVLGNSDNPVKFLGLEGGTGVDVTATYRSSDGFTQLNANGTNLTTVIDGQALYADLSQATAATINQLREAILMQQFLETAARSGTRYKEFIKGFFGVDIGDSTIQQPEFLAEYHMNINVKEVVQTSGINMEDGTALGTTGAVSRTAGASKNLLTFSCSEFGYIYCVGCVRHRLTYSQGISPMWTRLKGTDFYNPAWEGMGEVGIKKRQVLAPVGYSSDFMKAEFQTAGQDVGWDEEIGFNEPFAEYKYFTNRASGIMNPVAKEGLDYYTLASAFTSTDITAADLRVASKRELQRALSIKDQPQFLADFMVFGSVVRKMRKFSSPGVDRV